MRRDMLPLLRCPRCHTDGPLGVAITSEIDREIREGTVTCTACQQRYGIEDGIIDLLYDPPEFVRREAAGLGRFAEVMRNDGWGKDRIRALPYGATDAYWYGQATSLNQLMERIPFQAGQRLLDVGSNTCWASNKFAERGLEVIALDITTTEMQGLKTAEYFFEKGVYFDRVLGVMFDLPIATGSLDYVFCCEVLHHNDGGNLRRTLKECYRVLKPGGKLLVINEPMKFPMDLKRDHAKEVAQFEGYEHTFFFHQYVGAAHGSGFTLQVLEPPYHPFFAGHPITLAPDLSFIRSLRSTLAHFGRRSRLLRNLYLNYLNRFRGGVSLNLIGMKATSG
jgi:SAM-dependent methyltransferase